MPGPKPKATEEALEALSLRFEQLSRSLSRPAVGNANDLLTRLNQLEKLVLKMAHMAGTAHSTIRDSDLAPYNPQKSEMSKFNKKAM